LSEKGIILRVKMRERDRSKSRIRGRRLVRGISD
jgi:hypothetical protein